MKTKRVGIMGGTFNPIHNGHIRLALKAKEFLNLDEILFIPSGTSYMKKTVLAAEHRYRMVELAIENYPFFSISNMEMLREGNTYTVDTLVELKNLHPNVKYYFIMGADSLFSMETWYKPEQICELCTIVCAVRDNYSMVQLQKQASHLGECFHADIVLLPMDRIDISSTEIRQASLTDDSIKNYVPEKVASYIERYHLYG